MKDQECLCGRRDPVEGVECEVCGMFFCGACIDDNMIIDPTIDHEIVDIKVCTEHCPEEIIEHLEAEQHARMQRLINSGDAWRLEGPVGRHAMSLIEAGLCVLGEEGQMGAYGNYVPSRHEVKAGTKGSLEYQKQMQKQ